MRHESRVFTTQYIGVTVTYPVGKGDSGVKGTLA